MDDVERLTHVTRQFIDGFRIGDWSLVDKVLAPDFVFTNGSTGETLDRAAYRALLTGPTPSLSFDDVAVHVFDDVAVVTARTTREGVSPRRFVDTWVRTSTEPGWLCIHGCIWPIEP
jgi:hypothetical protein